MGFCVQQSWRNYYSLEWEATCSHSLLPSSATGNRLLFLCSTRLPRAWGSTAYKPWLTELVTWSLA